jgi:hypothetical protein
MAAAARSMDGVVAQAVTDVGGQYTIFAPNVLRSIPDKIEQDHVFNVRDANESINDAITTAIGARDVDTSLPVVIQLDMTPDFIAGDLVLIYNNNKASPLNQSIYTGNVFTVSETSQSAPYITIDIHRIDATVTLEQVMDEFKSENLYVNNKKWTDRLPELNGKSWTDLPFKFRVEKTRCVLVTKYESHPDQLVVVFGPPPASASAGGAKRKRVISRKLKSLNKKRKYTQRRVRRRYSYKRVRKN